MPNVRQTFLNLSPRGRVALAAAVVGVIVLAFVMIRVATSPSYTTLLSGVDPAETSKITAALDEKGVAYELQNNGTALAVPKAQTAQARVALAEQGLPGKGSKPGWELFDDQKLGASDFQQKVSYQRALEGEISRTVEGVAGVAGAQVQLVLPEEQLFEDEQSPATAAVLLEGGAEAVEPSAVRGIAQLVSSSVKGLKSENVSITDSSGRLLWPSDGAGEGADGAMASTSGRQAAEERYERGLEGKLNALMAGTIGAGKARVQVDAELDASETTRDSLRYGRRKVALEETTEDERLRGAGAGAGGVSGTEGNDGVPNYVAGATGGDARYDRDTATRKNGVNKDVIRTKEPPGAVERKAVSLVLDETVSPAAVAELRRAVEGAAGIDTTRGDSLAVSQIPFATAKPEQPGVVPGLVGYVKYAGLGLGMLLFLGFLARHLRGREDAAFADQPSWLREIEAPAALAQLEQTRLMTPAPSADPGQFERLEPTADPDLDRMRRQVEDLAQRQPDRVAAQVRAWVNAD